MSKLKRENQINSRKQPRLSKLIEMTFPWANALGESRISVDVVGNMRTVLAALSYEVQLKTMLVIFMWLFVVLFFPRLAARVSVKDRGNFGSYCCQFIWLNFS